MLHVIGLLPKDNLQQVSLAYTYYKNQSPLAPAFKQTFCKTVEVRMLGVWYPFHGAKSKYIGYHTGTR